MTKKEREAIFEQLRKVLTRSEFGRAEAVGELILTRCFSGKISEWKDRQPGKNKSFRKIAEHRDCPMSKTSLCRDVGIFVALKTLPPEVTEGLTATHIAEVLKLDHDERIRFLREARTHGWSTHRLRKTIVEFRRRQGERRGRPPSPMARKSVQLLKKSAELAGQSQVAMQRAARRDARSDSDLRKALEQLERIASEIRKSLSASRARQDSHWRLAKAKTPRERAAS